MENPAYQMPDFFVTISPMPSRDESFCAYLETSFFIP